MWVPHLPPSSLRDLLRQVGFIQGNEMIDADDTIDADMLQEYARDDAKDVFLQEQIGHWYCDVDETQTFNPEHCWLKNWISRNPTDDEFEEYSHEYNVAMKRALYVVNKLYNTDIPDDECIEHIADVVEQALKAIGKGL